MRRALPSECPIALSLPFFALTFALSTPWWLLSTVVTLEWLPNRLPTTDAGAVFMPTLAAVVLTHRVDGWEGVRRLLARVCDGGRPRRGSWAAYLVLSPLLYLLTYAAMRLLGFDLPGDWRLDPQILSTFLVFLVGATAEELGYTAYATEPLLEQCPPAVAGVVLGVPWALWHLPSMVQVGQSTGLITWGLAATVAFRVIYVHFYAHLGRSLFGIVLLHALLNTGRAAFPGGRAVFERGDAAVGYAMVIVLAVSLSFLWGRPEEAV